MLCPRLAQISLPQPTPLPSSRSTHTPVFTYRGSNGRLSAALRLVRACLMPHAAIVCSSAKRTVRRNAGQHLAARSGSLPEQSWQPAKCRDRGTVPSPNTFRRSGGRRRASGRLSRASERGVSRLAVGSPRAVGIACSKSSQCACSRNRRSSNACRSSAPVPSRSLRSRSRSTAWSSMQPVHKLATLVCRLSARRRRCPRVRPPRESMRRSSDSVQLCTRSSITPVFALR
mmetsp:Transcript_8064/g.26557  ORF Transcript_8064/g.26557 Transcript_8064/m.26557 type:complete len:230 (-) Transcript_8064:775-1464(-)